MKSPPNAQSHRAIDSPHLARSILLLIGVVVLGTGGFMILEPTWSIWRSLYFTVVTISTVGYGDEGIGEQTRAFAATLILIGIGTCTYALGQIVQFAVSRQLAWRQRMQRHIDRMSDHFIVCGLGRVGRAVCERFSEASLPVVVIDPDEHRDAWAREHGHLAIEGDASEDEVLLRAGVERARGIVCATNNDAENLAITLSARELNQDIIIISRADDVSATRKFKRAGATHVISPAANGGQDIATMLIRPHLADFLQRARANESGYQLTEIVIEAGSRLDGTTLLELGKAERRLVFVAVRHADGNVQLRPDMSYEFEPGAVVIVAGDLDAIMRMCEQAKGKAVYAKAG